MKNKNFGVLILSLLIILLSCKGKIVTDVYITDLLNLTNSAEVIYTKATLQMESPGEENLPKLKEILNQWFKDTENYRTEEIDYSDFLFVDVSIPIFDVYEHEYNELESIFGIFIENDDNTLYWGFSLDSYSFDQLLDQINTEFWTDMSIKDWDITINLINDAKESKTITIGNIYFNDEPVPYFSDFTLERRDEVKIDFGPILRDYIYQEDLVSIGILN